MPNWAIPGNRRDGIWYSSSDSRIKLEYRAKSPQPEFAHPYHVLAPHCQITIASPAGGEAPLDPSSIDKSDKISAEFLSNKETLWKHTEKLSSFIGRAKEFDAIFYVGGHGRKCHLLCSSHRAIFPPDLLYPQLVAIVSEELTCGPIAMFDLATDETSHQLIREFYESGRVVAAVCHGPAALVNAKLSDGSYLVRNAAITGFSNDEEDAVGLTSAMPFLLETELNKNSGGHFQKAFAAWGEKVVVAKDGRLITGQNPASATAVGKAIYEAISKS